MISCLQGKLTTEEGTLDRKKVEGCWARGQTYSIVIGLDLQPVTSWSADLCALFNAILHRACPGLSSRHDLCQTTKKIRYRRNNSAQIILGINGLLAIVGRIYCYLRACQTNIIIEIKRSHWHIFKAVWKLPYRSACTKKSSFDLANEYRSK